MKSQKQDYNPLGGRGGIDTYKPPGFERKGG